MMDKGQIRREKLLFQYSISLDIGDIDRVLAILQEAENDPILDHMIRDLDSALIEAVTTVSEDPSSNHVHMKEEHPMISIARPTPQISINRPRIPTTLIAAVFVTIVAGGLLFFISNPPPNFFASGGVTPVQQDDSNTPEDSIYTDYIETVWNNGDTSNLGAFVTENHVLSSDDEATLGTDNLADIVDSLHDVMLDFSLETTQLEMLSDSTAEATVLLTLSLDSLDLPIDLPDGMSEIAFDTIFTMRMADGLIVETNIAIDEDSLQAALSSNPLLELIDMNDLLIFNLSFLGSSNDNDDSEGLQLPDLPDCETGDAVVLSEDMFTVPAENTEAATVLLYVPQGLFTVSEGTREDDTLFEAEAVYQGAMGFEVSGDSVKDIRLLQNNACSGYSIASVDVALSADVPLTTQFIVTNGNLDADLRDLNIEQLETLLVSGAFELVLADTDTPMRVETQVSSGSLDLTIPEGAIIESMTVDVSSGIATITAEDDVSFAADFSLASGLMDIDIPSDSGLQITITGSALGALEMPSDMNEIEDGVWQSDNFESSETQVILNLVYTTGNVEIRH